MKVINLKHNNWPNNGPITLTIGNFDGIHLGHQRLINEVLKYEDTKSAILTFDPHPISFLRDTEVYTLMDKDEKISEFAKFNLDYLFIANFNNDLAKLTMEQFISNLKDLNVKRLVLGRDFRFANKGVGSVKDLEPYFEVIVLDDILYKETRISTTYIKDLLRSAKLEEVKYLLNKRYHINGFVEKGNQIGKSLGFPTANINYNNYYLPKNGVYFVDVIIEGIKYYGICNVGNNPTINYSFIKKIEVYIMNFNKDIYNKAVTIVFNRYLREEKKFASKKELIKQLNQDKNDAQSIINNLNMIK